MAQRMDLPLINICSTCQGVQSMAQNRMRKNSKLADEVNAVAGRRGPATTTREAGLEVKNFLWVLVEDIGLDKLKSMVKKPLTGLKVGPFYGCYIIRPEGILGYGRAPGPRPLPGVCHRGAGLHADHLRGSGQVLRLPDPDDQQEELADHGRKPP